MKKAIEKDADNVYFLMGDTEKKGNLDMVLNCLLVNTGDEDKDFKTNEMRVQKYANLFDSDGCFHLLRESKYFDKRFFEVVATYAPDEFNDLLHEIIYETNRAVYNAAFDFARTDLGRINAKLLREPHSIYFDYSKVAQTYSEQELYEAYKKFPKLMDFVPDVILSKWNRRMKEENVKTEEKNEKN